MEKGGRECFCIFLKYTNTISCRPHWFSVFYAAIGIFLPSTIICYICIVKNAIDKVSLRKALFFQDYFLWALLIRNYIFVMVQKEICMRKRDQEALGQKRGGVPSARFPYLKNIAPNYVVNMGKLAWVENSLQALCIYANTFWSPTCT